MYACEKVTGGQMRRAVYRQTIVGAGLVSLRLPAKYVRSKITSVVQSARPNRGPVPATGTGVSRVTVAAFNPPADRAAGQGQIALPAEPDASLHRHFSAGPEAATRSRAGLREDA